MSESTIDDRLDADYAPAWRPEPGDKLIGEVTNLTENDGAYGTYPVITIKQDDGAELALHAFHSVAASKLAEQRPQVGERIGIAYKGKKTKTDGSGSYHNYTVAKDGPTGGVDWGKYGGDEPDGGSDLPSTSDFAATTAPPAAADDEPIPF